MMPLMGVYVRVSLLTYTSGADVDGVEVRKCAKVSKFVKMRRCEDTKMRRCEDGRWKMRSWKMEDAKMRSWKMEDAKMRRCEDGRCEDGRWKMEDAKLEDGRCEDGRWKMEEKCVIEQ